MSSISHVSDSFSYASPEHHNTYHGSRFPSRPQATSGQNHGTQEARISGFVSYSHHLFHVTCTGDTPDLTSSEPRSAVCDNFCDMGIPAGMITNMLVTSRTLGTADCGRLILPQIAGGASSRVEPRRMSLLPEPRSSSVPGTVSSPTCSVSALMLSPPT